MTQKTVLRTVFTSLMVYCALSVGAQGIIRTIAGAGIAGYLDGVDALSARFSSPSGVAVDLSGNIYIADKGNSRIRKISPASGVVSTVAGTGVSGYSGMGGPAISAQIMMPNAICVDHAGNYYFTDWFNDAAFIVNGSTNNIMNYCGHHTQGYTGDGGDACMATLEIPNGVWKDNITGDVYIVDAGSNHLRVVNGATHIVQTFAGGAYGYSGDGGPVNMATFSGISGVCTDHFGNIYISDAGNNCIRKVGVSGIVHTIAGTGVAGYSGDGGSGQHALLSHPASLFINNAGYLFICELGNNVVRVLNTNSDIIYTLAGNGTVGFSGDMGLAISAQLNQPSGVWQDASSAIYIADAGNQRIRKVTGSGYKISPNDISNVSETNFSVYPNPTSGTLNIHSLRINGNNKVEVFNMFGVKVFEQSISNPQTQITLNEPTGIYSVVITSESGTQVHKVAIQN